MIREFWASILEELEAMGSGRFVPYHKLSLLVVVVIALLFSLVFRHDVIFEAPVAVIDLDATRYSTQLIEKINSSAYIRVTGVYNTPMPVAALTKHDGNVGVLYLPQGLEKEVLTGHRAMNIGYFSDYSNAAQNADVIENLKEITAHEGAQIGVAKVSALGLGATETQAAMNPLSVVNRNLFNPTGSFTTGTTIGFVYFFSSLFYGLTVLMIPGRLRITGLWQRAVLPRGSAALLARGIPYALFYTTAITVMTAVLVLFGQLRFAGNYWTYVPSIFMTGLGFAWLALIVDWSTENPGAGAGRMTFIVPPGFILGGATMALGYMPQWAYLASHAFPLTWQFAFWRDFGLRGLDLASMLSMYGIYLIYLALLGVIVALLHERSRRQELPAPGQPAAA